MNNRWSSQFVQSLNRAREREPVDKHLRDFFSGPLETEEEIAAVAMPYVATQAFQHFYAGLEQVSLFCESPIESAMLFALILSAPDYVDELAFHAGPATYGDPDTAPDSLIIESQARVGEYRADFLLTWRSRWSFTEFADHHLIVECDGHDFHDRTKEQASRDRKRDRALQRAGYPVHRFTGSDIWRDVFGCATEALDALHEMERARVERLKAETGPEAAGGP